MGHVVTFHFHSFGGNQEKKLYNCTRHKKINTLNLKLRKSKSLKGIVHFEINFWYVLSYLKGIQDVGVFVSAVFSILIFLGQTVSLSVI